LPGVFTVDPSIVIYNRQMYLLNTGVGGVTLPFNSTNFETELAANIWISASFNPNADQTITGKYDFTQKPTENGIGLVNAVELEHGLTSILAQLPVNFRRYLTRNETTLFDTSYYIAQEEKPTGATLDINAQVTATTYETANVIARFVGPAFTKTIEIDTERSNIHIHSFKNNTNRIVCLFAEYYSMATDGSLTFRASSEIQILTQNDLKFSLSIALPSFTILPGTRPVIVFKSYQTGGGAVASATIRVDNDTYSRFEFSVSSVNITQSHPDLTGRDLPDQHPISAITGLGTALKKIKRVIAFNNVTSLVCSDFYPVSTTINTATATRIATIERSLDNISFAPATFPLVVNGSIWWRISYISGQTTGVLILTGQEN